jgi:membrane protein YqaA with SNARE-associated domain
MSLPLPFDQLPFYFAYLFVDALLLPLASTVYVIYMGERHAPFLVAVLGAFATALGSIGQYLLVRWILRHKRASGGWIGRQRERLEHAIQGSSHATFWALFVIYATPLGAGPLRLIAAAGGYSLWRFALAILLGCLPYYYVLARVGEAVRFPAWVYACAGGAFLAIGLAQWLAGRARANERRKGNAAP